MALQLAKKGLDQIKMSNGKDDKYSHLTEEEVKTVEKTVHEKWTWLEEKRILLASTLRTQQPPVTVAHIRAEKQVSIEKIGYNYKQFSFNLLIFSLFIQSMDSVVLPILNKPKPKVEPPKEEKPKDKPADEQKNNQNQNAQGNNHSQSQQQQQQTEEEKMDVE